MSKLSQTMKMVSGSTTYQIPFYTTTTEAGAYGTYGSANVGGTACYYGLGTGASVATGSEVKTPLKVVKSSTTYYMLTKGNAELATYTLKLNAMATNQTVTLKYKNRNITDTGYETEVTKTSTSSAQSFTVRKNTTWTASVAADTGWTAGTLSPGTSGTVTATTTVSVTAATYKTFTLKLSATENQTITLKYKNKKSDGTFESEATKTSTSSDQSFTVGYGTTWTATLTADTGYTKGTLSGSSGTVTAATTVSATAATAITPTVTITYSGHKDFDCDIYNIVDGTTTTLALHIDLANYGTVSYNIAYNSTISIKSRQGSVTWKAKTGSGSYTTGLTYHDYYTVSNITANKTITIVGEYTGGTSSSGEGD